MADGGNVEFVEIDGPIVRLRLKGACGSCPSSTTTMTMGIERRMRERIPEVVEIEQVHPCPNPVPPPHRILPTPSPTDLCHACAPTANLTNLSAIGVHSN